MERGHAEKAQPKAWKWLSVKGLGREEAGVGGSLRYWDFPGLGHTSHLPSRPLDPAASRGQHPHLLRCLFGGRGRGGLPEVSTTKSLL